MYHLCSFPCVWKVLGVIKNTVVMLWEWVLMRTAVVLHKIMVSTSGNIHHNYLTISLLINLNTTQSYPSKGGSRGVEEAAIPCYVTSPASTLSSLTKKWNKILERNKKKDSEKMLFLSWTQNMFPHSTFGVFGICPPPPVISLQKIQTWIPYIAKQRSFFCKLKSLHIFCFRKSCCSVDYSKSGLYTRFS